MGDGKDLQELNLTTAGKWARGMLVSYKMFEERARSQNIWELIRPEALETVQEFLWDASEYELQVKYPAEIVATGGTEAQKIARRKWIK